MREPKSLTKDPICRMTVDEATAPHAERDGGTFHMTSRARWSTRRHVKRLLGYATSLLFLGTAVSFAANVEVARDDKGRGLYKAKCQFCHGIRGDGNGPAAESLLGHPVDFTDSTFWKDDVTKKIYETITHGKEMMPAFDLTPDEIAAITSYISHTFKNAPHDDTGGRIDQ